MFNFKSKEMKEERKYKGSNLYLANIRNVDIERFLAILFSMVEGYIKQEQKTPEKIIINEENYKKILDYNNKLIIEKDNKKYILCVELEVERDRKRR